MKSRNFKQGILFAAVLLIALINTSCKSIQKTYIVPNAINTVNSVELNELNLVAGDYEILNTITSEAIIKATIKENNAEIHEENGEFSLYYKDKGLGMFLNKYSGVVRQGYLDNVYSRTNFNEFNPEVIAIRLASYRAINIAQQYGSDGLIEPIISTKAEQKGNEIIFKTTVTAKLIQLKTSK